MHKPFPGFRSFPTHHCVTGSMRHMYQLGGRDVGEELLLGLGASVGFVYWQQKGQLPFLGGRANTERKGEEGLERLAGRRTGVVVTHHVTSSARTAESELVADLSVGTPAMVQVDMGLLPWSGRRSARPPWPWWRHRSATSESAASARPPRYFRGTR